MTDELKMKFRLLSHPSK